MSIAKRLYLLLFSVAAGLAALSGVGIFEIQRVYTDASYATVNTVPSLLALSDAFVAFSQMRTEVWQHMASQDADKRAALERSIAASRLAVGKALQKYEKKNVSDAHDRSLLAADRAVLARYDVIRDRVMALSKAGKLDDARDLMMDNQPVIQQLVDALAAHHRYNEDLGDKGAAEAAATAAHARAILVGLTLAGAVLVSAMGLLLARRILVSIGRAGDVARTIADGDLRVSVHAGSKDEIDRLMSALAEMSGSLVRIVAEVRAGTDTISTATGEIAAGNLDLSARTEQQAGSLEETASAMEEMTSTVRQNADNARQAKQMAISASDKAQRGSDVMSEVIRTMEAIDHSSGKIVDIISVIDSIAFQTNILALNAAVEAARAGEQGRGFAVVATEVRNLAHRSAAAAKEIKNLISDSVEKVAQGDQLVQQAGVAMAEVVETVRNVAYIVSEISAASTEQSTGIEEINRAIAQMDEMTQQNAALVEEAAAASQSLQEQTGKLAAVVSIFKLAQDQKQATAVPGPTPRRTAPRQPATLTLVSNSAGRQTAAVGGGWEEF
ncbi:methyl-accepting chemotaxis protein [Janthinobacterium sp.]|uniref:methyl-accepting chemotaxis protein n=1 Tax=Janthinobacterium sp. TaxID=1871054 RepID=UPI002627747F|nr:methyl-accepting chemotaxis protein [Janthinobacterium sp.]